MTDYKAKPEVWKGFETLYGVHNPFNPLHSDFVDSILELRSRIEVLEAAAKPAEFNYPAKPNSSLVERVQKAIGHSYPEHARAVIREVAAWLHEENNFIPSWTFLRVQKELES